MLTVAILLSLVVVGAAWRLSHAPVDLGFLKDRIERALNQAIAPAHVTIGGASIAWRGFSHGLDQPLVLRVRDLSIAEAGSAAAVRIPDAEATLSSRWLLIGRILPRSLTLDGAHLLLIRDASGAVSFGVDQATDTASKHSTLSGLIGVLAAPRQTDLQPGGRRLSQLSSVSIHDATLRFDDRALGVTLTADPASIDLTRHVGGGVDGRAVLTLALGGQRAILAGTFSLPAGGQSVHVAASLSRVTPSALADDVPILRPLKALDVPLTLNGQADLGRDLTPTFLRVNGAIGAGSLATGTGSLPISGASFVVAGTPEQAKLERATVALRPGNGAPITTLTAAGDLTHQNGQLGAALHLTLDHVTFGDLPALWPVDVAPHARDWILANVTAGTAHDGTADIALRSPDDTPDVSLPRATASLDGDDLSVSWLKGVPPIDRAKAHLVLTDPDRIEIDVRSARQTVSGGDPIAIPHGHVTLSGLSAKDQVATVQCDVVGSIPSAIALLKEPRLRLLDKHPVDLPDASGDARISIHAVVPLINDLRIDDVAIHATGNLTRAHVSHIVAGRDLDDGALLLDADTNRLTVKGNARLGGIPATIDGMLDFRAGQPSQVVQHFQATGRATAAQLAGAGIKTDALLTGDVGMSVVLNEHRDGAGEVNADIDLTQSGVTVGPLAWGKPAGAPASASARLLLAKDKLTGVDRLTVDGPGLSVSGGVSVVDGRFDTVRLDRAVFGRTDVHGSIHLAPNNGPIGVMLSGPVLDLAAKLNEHTPKHDPAEPPGPAWSLQGRFDHVLLSHGQSATQVTATGDSDGTIMRDLAIAGRTASGKPFSVRIGPGDKVGGGRRLSINAEDAGGFLAGLDITGDIRGGVLTLTGDYDDTRRDHLLSGTLEVTDFSVQQAPALGKLLQAVTLYGLVDALSGPGLNFSRLTAPFQVDDATLMLHDARAFSASLGLTVKGEINRDANTLDLEGTLVPAYVFNSVLGRIPLIGRLFSAEKGGGLIAMNYALHGPIDNPSVTVNPLSVVTPGFLRGLFGLLDRTP